MTDAIKCPRCKRECKLEDIHALGFALIADCVCGHQWGVNALWTKTVIPPPAVGKLPPKQTIAKI